MGHKEHDEAIGTMAIAPESVTLIENEEQLVQLPDSPEPVAMINQTTLSLDEWAGIRELAERKFPNLWMANRSDLCFATTNRQLAIREITKIADTVVVIGSANSSNTVALEKTAWRYGARKVYRINNPSELPDDIGGIVGIAAGASAPEDLVQAVVDKLNPQLGVQEICVTDEDEYFPPPPELRDLLRAISAAVALAFAAPLGSDSPLDADRLTSASSTLNELRTQTSIM